MAGGGLTGRALAHEVGHLTQQSVTLEAIMTGAAANSAVDGLKNTLANCAQVTATSAQIGQATVQFSPVDASGIGAQAAAASYTTTVTPPNQPAITVPALVGVVRDGDRLILLLSANADAASVNGGPPPAAPDQAAFIDLLKNAYTTQHEALG